jgi:hypothetical protein
LQGQNLIDENLSAEAAAALLLDVVGVCRHVKASKKESRSAVMSRLPSSEQRS